MSDGKDVHKMTRDELNNYAGELGIADAAELANKDEVIAAIEAANDDQDTQPTDDDDTDAAPDDEPADDADAAPDDAQPEPSGQTYEVLKAVTDDEGRTYMPGEQFTPGSGFPSRRPKQLVDQKFLRPLD